MLDSVIGAGREFPTVQHDEGSLAPTSVECFCDCIIAIMGQSGGQCIEGSEAEDSGVHASTVAIGAISTISTSATDSDFCQIHILDIYALF